MEIYACKDANEYIQTEMELWEAPKVGMKEICKLLKFSHQFTTNF